MKIVQNGINFQKIGVLQGINEKFFKAMVLFEPEPQPIDYKYEEICKFI